MLPDEASDPSNSKPRGSDKHFTRFAHQYRNNSNIMFDSSYNPNDHPYEDWLPDDPKMLGLVLELPSEEYRDVTLRYFVPYPFLRQRGGVLNLRYETPPP